VITEYLKKSERRLSNRYSATIAAWRGSLAPAQAVLRCERHRDHGHDVRVPAADAFGPELTAFRLFGTTDEGRAWLAGLPECVRHLEEKWGVRTGRPFAGGPCSWVAPGTTADGSPVVLKITWPHREARGESIGLKLWNGRGAPRTTCAWPPGCCATSGWTRPVITDGSRRRRLRRVGRHASGSPGRPSATVRSRTRGARCAAARVIAGVGN
jgi:hypothetical protein